MKIIALILVMVLFLSQLYSLIKLSNISDLKEEIINGLSEIEKLQNNPLGVTIYNVLFIIRVWFIIFAYLFIMSALI